jgi:hypothetical protein
MHIKGLLTRGISKCTQMKCYLKEFTLELHSKDCSKEFNMLHIFKTSIDAIKVKCLEVTLFEELFENLL